MKIAVNIANRIFNFGVGYWIEQNCPQYMSAYDATTDGKYVHIDGIKLCMKRGLISSNPESKAFGI